jgi:hypothetical protein
VPPCSHLTSSQAVLRDAINGVVIFQVSKEAIAIDRLFEAVEAQREAIGIKDWGLSQTSLEEVFLQIVASTSDASSVEPSTVGVEHLA